MLTLADALQLPEFTGALLVAGRAGLQRRVSWVHVVAVPDAAEWLNGGELVLTTANTLPDSAAAQRAYILALADKGVAGLALAVGRFIDHASEALREAAEDIAFPLIELPYQIRFVDVAKALNQRLIAANMSNVERALDIHRKLTQLVLEGGELKSLAETLARLINQSVSIENERFEALASHNLGVVDEARRYTLSEGHTDPRLIRALETGGILSQIATTLRPVHIPQMPSVGLEMERILAPIVVHGDLYGYIWIIADDRPLSDLDRLAIESGATVAALMIFHQEAVQNAEASLKGGLLAQLIQGDIQSDAVLLDQVLRYGLNTDEPLVMVLLDPIDRSTARLLQLDRRLNRFMTARGLHAIAGQFAGQMVFLTQAGLEMSDFTQELINVLGGGVRITLSAAVAGMEKIPSLYTQCQETLHIALRMKMAESVIQFEQLGYLHTLYKAGVTSLAANPYVVVVRQLEASLGTDMLHTLETYLDVGGNGVVAAEALQIHRSTLNYRLDRIEQQCNLNLSDPATRTNLQVAVKLLRLFETS